MEDKIRRLQPAVQVAGTQEDKAVKALAEQQRHLAQNQAQLQQLLSFRHDYLGQFQSVGQSGISGRRLHNYQVFLASLDTSITQSQRHVQVLEQGLQQKHSAWIQCRAKSHALKEILRNYQVAQNQAIARREQADTDERALQNYCKKDRQPSGM